MSFTSPRLIAAAVIVLLVAGGAIGLAVLRSPAQCHRPAVARGVRARAVGAAVASRGPPRAPPMFVDPNTYIFAMDPGYASPGTDAPPAGSRSPAQASRTAAARPSPSTATSDDPAWSPDGSQIAFVSATTAGASLWTAAADGSKPVKVASCASPCSSIHRPAWSPDGTRLVFTETDILQAGAADRRTDRCPDACRRRPCGRRPRRAGCAAADGGWSPHGDKLVYDRFTIDATGQPTAASLWTIGADGKGDTAMAGLPPTAASPRWSAADVIAFGDGLNIFTVPAAGGTPTKVTNLSATSQQANRSPGWTPDGRISTSTSRPMAPTS